MKVRTIWISLVLSSSFIGNQLWAQEKPPREVEIEALRTELNKMYEVLTDHEKLYVSVSVKNAGKKPKLSFDDGMKVTSIIDKENVIVLYSGNALWVEGIDTSTMITDQMISMKYPMMVVVGTKTYTTVLGSARTVPHLVVLNNKKLEKIIALAMELELKRADLSNFRNWTNAADAILFNAKYLEFKSGNVRFERKDNGKIEEIALSDLSKPNQKWVRDELHRQAEKKQVEKKSATQRTSK
jgi:hypothetical protein